jgi:hypothetical protein
MILIHINVPLLLTVIRFYFQHIMGIEMTTPEISLNIKGSSLTMFAQSMTYPQRCFKQTLITNAFLKTTVRNNVSVLDFIVHYLLHVSAPISSHLQVKCTQNIY